MLIILLDESALFVYPSAAPAEHDIEAIDAEEEIRAAFDDSAVPYRVEWIRPNNREKILFGLFTSIMPGKYRLVPAGPAEPAALVQLLESYPDANPPEAKATLASLLAKLRAT